MLPVLKPGFLSALITIVSLHLATVLVVRSQATAVTDRTLHLEVQNVGRASYDQQTRTLKLFVADDNADFCLQPICPMRRTECLDLDIKSFGREVCQVSEKNYTTGEASVVFQNVEQGRYVINDSGFFDSFCLYRASGNVSQWNVTLQLEEYGATEIHLTITQLGIMGIYNFSKFIVELQKLPTRERVDVMVIDYSKASVTYNFTNVQRKVEHWAIITPLDCRCVNEHDSTSIPCTRHSNKVFIEEPAVTELPSQQSLDSSVLWYSVAVLLIIAVLSVSALVITKLFSLRQESSAQAFIATTTRTREERASSDLRVLLLYCQDDERIRKKVAELRANLEHLSCVVYDYGDEAQKESVLVEGHNWFASRFLQPETRVVVVISATMQRYEEALLNQATQTTPLSCEDQLCYSGLNYLLTVNSREKQYSRIFCVKFKDVDEDSDCKSLVPLRRFVLPQHLPELTKFLIA